MVDKPKLKSQKSSSPATQPVPNTGSANPPEEVITSGGGAGGSRGGSNSGGGVNRGGGSNSEKPSPWLLGDKPLINSSASFVEYLRWMRSPDSSHKDPTKIQILQLAEEGADYTARLTQLTKRTKLIAGEGNYFEVTCPWRIRVGGHQGPESILLPAFDALGMPYIPSSTLRGVARAEALRQLRDEKEVAKYFGSLDANESDRMGKVIFLDAYPLPTRTDKSGGLAVDIANNIWTWEDDRLKYSPNPNPFLSLQNPTFLIGIRSAAKCDDIRLTQIRAWLTAGLQSGAGSQINSGYGELIGNKAINSDSFFQVNFAIRGQLVHGRQKFTQWQRNQNTNQWITRGKAEAEVRPIAFKSMLRYWFRAFALGVLPVDRVKYWEASLFGSINPQKLGYVSVRVHDGEVVKTEARASSEGRNDPFGEEEGLLILSYSSQIPENHKASTAKLFENLTWMMFHLGGIGQGARRPLYSRKNRDHAPWWRGSNLVAFLTNDSTQHEEEFWELPDTCAEFQKIFQAKLIAFYTALQDLSKTPINHTSPMALASTTKSVWSEAVDSNCKIFVCTGGEQFSKPYALSTLHSDDFKDRGAYNPNLCGTVRANPAKSSPVWVCNPENKYQVVTVFGATQDPRKAFVKKLMEQGAIQIFPMT